MDKKFTIDISDSLAIKYEISKDITPEELAQLVVCLGYVLDGKVYGPLLEANGHINASERFEKCYRSTCEKLISKHIKKEVEVPYIQPLDGFEQLKRILGDIPK